MREIVKNRLYRHYKGGYYYVLDVALHTETNENLVIYRSLSDDRLYARPENMFLEEAPQGEENATNQKYRFCLVS